MIFYREESHVELRKREAAQLRKEWIRSAPAEQFKRQLRSRLKNISEQRSRDKAGKNCTE